MIDLFKLTINKPNPTNSLKIEEEEKDPSEPTIISPITDNPVQNANASRLTTKQKMRLAIQRNSRLNQERKAAQPYIPW